MNAGVGGGYSNNLLLRNANVRLLANSSSTVASAVEEAVASSDKFEEIILSLSSGENEVDDELGLGVFRLDGFFEGDGDTTTTSTITPPV